MFDRCMNSAGYVALLSPKESLLLATCWQTHVSQFPCQMFPGPPRCFQVQQPEISALWVVGVVCPPPRWVGCGYVSDQNSCFCYVVAF